MVAVKDIHQMLIYAVDDDSTNQKLINTLLSKNNFERYKLIYSGTELLKQINIEIPDLILLDIFMPVLSGHDVLGKIKENPELKHIPVIMITAAPLEEDREYLRKSFELGAMDYITKPINETELVMRIRSALILEKQRQELETALKTIRTLERLLPICSYCKKIRSDKMNWQEVEVYISDHTDTMFSHSICPDCYDKYVKPQLDSIRDKK